MKTYLKKADAAKVKGQICALYDIGEDWRPLARSLGVNLNTAHRWVRTPDRTDKRLGGQRKSKINEEHCRFIEQCIERDPKVTLKLLREDFERRYQLKVSSECIRVHMGGLLYTLRDTALDQEKANCEEAKLSRCQDAQQLLKFQADVRPILYLGSSNLHLHMLRKLGPSKTVTRSPTIADGSRGSNMFLLGAMLPTGAFEYKLRQGTFTPEEKQEFVHHCLALAHSTHPTGFTVVLSPSLPSLSELLPSTDLTHFPFLALNTHSAMLHPLHFTFFTLIANVKRDFTSRLPGFLVQPEDSTLTYRAFGRHQIESVLLEHLPQVTPETNHQSFQQAYQKWLEAVSYQDFPF